MQEKLSNEHLFFVCMALSRQEDMDCQELCNDLWNARNFNPDTESHLAELKNDFETYDCS